MEPPTAPCVCQPGEAKALTSPCPELLKQHAFTFRSPAQSAPCLASDALLWVGGKTPAYGRRKVWGHPDPWALLPTGQEHRLRLGVGGEAVGEDQQAWPWAWATTSEEARSALGSQPECPLRLPAGATHEVSPAAARAGGWVTAAAA